jgi:hypothetical protein
MTRLEERQMRALALSFILFTLAVPVTFAGGPIDTATLTCKVLETSRHNDMVAMEKAIYESLKSDPKFGALSESQLINAVYKACDKYLKVKVIDALRAEN